MLDKFEQQIDPNNELSPAERAKPAEHARKAHFKRLALKSTRAPYDMAPEQLESLFLAGKSAQSFSTTIDKSGQHNKALFGGTHQKSAWVKAHPDHSFRRSCCPTHSRSA
jgi:hypothetical protein